MDNDPFRTQRDVGLAVVTELDAAGFADAEEIGRGGFGFVLSFLSPGLGSLSSAGETGSAGLMPKPNFRLLSVKSKDSTRSSSGTRTFASTTFPFRPPWKCSSKYVRNCL